MMILCVQDKQPDIRFISARLLPCKLSGFPLSYDDDDDDDDDDGDDGDSGGDDDDAIGGDDEDLPCKLSGFIVSYHPSSHIISSPHIIIIITTSPLHE